MEKVNEVHRACPNRALVVRAIRIFQKDISLLALLVGVVVPDCDTGLDYGHIPFFTRDFGHIRNSKVFPTHLEGYVIVKDIDI